MKSKIVAMLSVCLITLSTSCLAMTFSQPVKIGSVSDHGIVGGGYQFEGAVSNSGTLYVDKNQKYYKNGTASFGRNSHLIYLHYNDKNYYDKQSIRCYGGKNLNNTFRFTQAYGCDFSQIETDIDITLYMIHEWQFDSRGEKYTMLGRMKDGTFVKYFDTWDISERYFDGKYPHGYFYDKWYCNGSQITIEYAQYGKSGKIKSGEFRFKWDDAAQWFGIEQVVY